ncbi:MAG: class I SAM-dependent methyltransferase, partial [Pontibacterium sp.]
ALQWMKKVKKQLLQTNGEMRRLFHGRGGCFEGYGHLAIDWYPPVAVIRAYSPLEQDERDTLVILLSQLEAVEGVVVQYRSQERHAINETAYGKVPDKMVAQELGLSYAIKPAKNQNCGLFLDMREGRRWVRDNSQGKRVLNLFSYTCGFSVAAAAGGASHIVNVDMSRSAIDVGRENHRLNGTDPSCVTFLAYDLFRSWKKVKQLGQYDLLIVDPPSFQKGSFIADKDYQRVVKRLDDLVAVGGQLLLCHNDPMASTDFLTDLMAEHCPAFTFEQRLENPSDFPEVAAEKGLKVLLYRK